MGLLEKLREGMVPTLNEPVGPTLAYRERQMLVISRDAHFPEVCVKCGANGALERTVIRFLWAPRWVKILSFVNPLGQLLTATQTLSSPMSLPFCARCMARWRSGERAHSWAHAPGAVAVVAGVVSLFCMKATWPLALIIGGAAAFFLVPGLTSLLYTTRRKLWTVRMTDQLIWISGVHPAAIDAACLALAPAHGMGTSGERVPMAPPHATT